MTTGTPRASTSPIQLAEARIASCNLFTPTALREGGASCYRATLLLDPADPKMRASMDALLTAAANVWARSGGSGAPPSLPFSAGETHLGRDGKVRPGFAGQIVMTASAIDRPAAFGSDRTALDVDDGSLYPGAFASVIVRLNAKSKGKSPGVYAELCGLLHLRHGDAIGWAERRQDVTLASFGAAAAGGAAH